ncbi:MAG: hypothetical protein JKY91_00500, partial [Emcibacter sp.]|nr:hypothetical protein [Emcibacter sp.]
MALCCYDEAYTIPSEYAQRISLRTMQLLIEEMGMCETVDPLAGSYYVETMTNNMRKKMEETMQEVEDAGGIIKMVSDGLIQSKVSEQAYGMQKDLQSGAFPKVGVNCYKSEDDENEVEFHPYDTRDADQQVKNLNAVKAERDQAEVDRTLAQVKTDAEADRNVMPAIVEAVKAYATVGEITKKLVEVYGYYQEPIRF